MDDDAFDLGKRVRQGMAVVMILFKSQRANEDVGVSRFGDRGFGAKFIFLRSLPSP